MKNRRFSANALFNVSSWFIPAVAYFFAVPITVRGLGPDRYGLLTIVGALAGYLALMDMGLATAIVRYLSYYRALDEGRPMVGIVKFAFAWFFVAGVIGAAVLFFGAPWFVQSVLKVPKDLWPMAETVVRLTAADFFLAMILSVASAIPPGFLRYDMSALGGAIFGTLGAVGPAALVSLGYGLKAIVLFGIVSNAAAVAMYSVFALRLFRTVTLTSGPEWKSVRRGAMAFGGLNALSRINGAVASQTNRLVVGIAGGTSDLAYYQVPNLISTNVNEMLARVAQVLFPTGADLMARQDREGVNRLYLRSSRLLFLVNASATMGVCLFAAPLLRYWVSPRFADKGALALLLFTVAQAVNACSMAMGNLSLSAGRAGVNLAFAASSTAISIAAVYPLTVRYGIAGAAAAGLLGSLNVPFYLHYCHRRILHVSSMETWRKSYRPTVLGVAAVGVGSYLLLAPLARNLVSTLLLAGLSAALAVLVSGLFGALSRQDIVTARRLAGAVLGRFRPEAT
jgi:O-antigen/teichoic acid export membrane protein